MISFEQRMRQRIERDLARVDEWVTSMLREAHPEEMEPAGDNTPLSEEADAAQAGEETEIRFRLLDALAERSQELRESLERIRMGRYGLCTRCGKDIHRVRLEAVPEAALCIRCKDLSERRRRHHLAAPSHWVEPDASRLAREDLEARS